VETWSGKDVDVADDVPFCCECEQPMALASVCVRQPPRTLAGALAKLGGIMPNATVGDDNDGQIVIYTNVRELPDGTLVELE